MKKQPKRENAQAHHDGQISVGLRRRRTVSGRQEVQRRIHIKLFNELSRGVAARERSTVTLMPRPLSRVVRTEISTRGERGTGG